MTTPTMPPDHPRPASTNGPPHHQSRKSPQRSRVKSQRASLGEFFSSLLGRENRFDRTGQDLCAEDDVPFRGVLGDIVAAATDAGDK